MRPHILLISTTLSALSSATQPPQSTLSQPSLSSTQPTATSGPEPPKLKNLTTPDNGHTYGNLVIHNWCSETFHLRSVGAHYLGGPRAPNSGWGTPQDDLYHALPARSTYTEPLRSSGGCPYTSLPPYCPLEDKLAGQAISVKISRTPLPSDTNITQIEYALYRDPHTRDTFKRLYYDVSLLDCASPELLHPGAGNVTVTDFNAGKEAHDAKVKLCPGYDGGVAMSFGADEGGDKCPMVYCDGREVCYMIYTFDRTRKVESSFTCAGEYRGEVRVDLCVGKGDGGAKAVADGFKKWAKTATHEVLMLQLGKTASATGVATAGVGSVGVASTGVAVPQHTVSGDVKGGSSAVASTTLSTVGAPSTSGTG